MTSIPLLVGVALLVIGVYRLRGRDWETSILSGIKAQAIVAVGLLFICAFLVGYILGKGW